MVDLDSTGKLAIQRCDECKRFVSDNAAVLYVDSVCKGVNEAAEKLASLVRKCRRCGAEEKAVLDAGGVEYSTLSPSGLCLECLGGGHAN